MTRPFLPDERVRVPIQVRPGVTELVSGIVSAERNGLVMVFVKLQFGDEEPSVYEGFYRRREVRRGWKS